MVNYSAFTYPFHAVRTKTKTCFQNITLQSKKQTNKQRTTDFSFQWFPSQRFYNTDLLFSVCRFKCSIYCMAFNVKCYILFSTGIVLTGNHHLAKKKKKKVRLHLVLN